MIAVSGTVTDGWEAFFVALFLVLLLNGLVDGRRRVWAWRRKVWMRRLAAERRERHGQSA